MVGCPRDPWVAVESRTKLDRFVTSATRALVPAMTMPVRSVAVLRQGLFCWRKSDGSLDRRLSYSPQARKPSAMIEHRMADHMLGGKKNTGTSLRLVAAEWHPGNDDANPIWRSVMRAVSLEASVRCVCGRAVFIPQRVGVNPDWHASTIRSRDARNCTWLDRMRSTSNKLHSLRVMKPASPKHVLCDGPSLGGGVGKIPSRGIFSVQTRWEPYLTVEKGLRRKRSLCNRA